MMSVLVTVMVNLSIMNDDAIISRCDMIVSRFC
jgi:hypothetical protein